MKKNYQEHLLQYHHTRKRKPPIKLLKTWINYIETNHIPPEQSYNYTTLFFQENTHYKNTTKNTKKIYTSEINQFNKSKLICYLDCLTNKNKKESSDISKSHLTEENLDEYLEKVETDDHSKELLQKYLDKKAKK